MMKKAILISLNDETSEIIQLADTLNYKIIETFIQHREKPDVKTYIGKGKIKQINDYLEDKKEEINLVIVDGKLKPSQWFNLEKNIEIDVYDRLRLILDIFEKNAERKEAKLQVRLAQLEYERPYVRELIHRTRSGEHPGLMAGGEYQVDDYYEMIKKQMKKIKSELNNITENRNLHRSHRFKSGFYMISLAGYTNAGKSSLLNLLTGEMVKVEGKLFSTLSTTTRRFKKDKIPILLTDTVGFIQNLPSWIIDSFHSTLEEIITADLILLVVDISEKLENIEEKIKVCYKELNEIGAKATIITVLNKIDKISEEELQKRTVYLIKKSLVEVDKNVSISIVNKENIDILHDIIFKNLPNRIIVDIVLPNNQQSQSFISWLYEKAYVMDISYQKNINISVECNSKIFNIITDKCINLNGKIN